MIGSSTGIVQPPVVWAAGVLDATLTVRFEGDAWRLRTRWLASGVAEDVARILGGHARDGRWECPARWQLRVVQLASPHTRHVTEALMCVSRWRVLVARSKSAVAREARAAILHDFAKLVDSTNDTRYTIAGQSEES